MARTACDVALFGAFLPEIEPLRAALGDALSGRIGGAYVVARAVGIGLPLASAGTALQVAELRPRAVVAVGTCGVYPNASSPALYRIEDVVTARRVRLASPCVAAGSAQLPAPMTVVAEAHPLLREGLERAGARPADVATTLAITVDDAAAAQTAAASAADVEHLEAFGVAAACAAQGVPFAAALGIANSVGAGARAEWRAHHEAAAAAAIAIVLRWLGAAPVLP
jgi:futalosine hydrolase